MTSQSAQDAVAEAVALEDSGSGASAWERQVEEIILNHQQICKIGHL